MTWFVWLHFCKQNLSAALRYLSDDGNSTLGLVSKQENFINLWQRERVDQNLFDFCFLVVFLFPRAHVSPLDKIASKTFLILKSYIQLELF